MKLHNTLTGLVEELHTLQDGVVRLYTCGLTVYSQPHIGNWLGYIYWDVLVKVLETEGYAVERTQNITDVGHLTSDDDNGEDKMEKGARNEGLTAWNVAEKYISIANHEAYELLKLRHPNHLIRATELINEQIQFSQALESKGLTYIIEGEGLYFDTSKLKDYGKLAKLDVQGLEAGKRVAVNGKRLVTDFAIWKFSPKDSKRDMEWESPWGVGFPGWHLECSVIARQTLGDQIDIHTGGIDHIPVHHTNEIAQTEGLTGKQFAHTWLHNNHIKIDGKKISKSIGNIVTLQDIIDRGFNMDAFKLLALSKHYRTEGNFNWTILEAAQNRLHHWLEVATLRHQTHETGTDTEVQPFQAAVGSIHEALRNDLDTPGALSIIDRTFKKIESLPLAKIDRHSLIQILETIRDVLGIDLLSTTPDIDDEAKRIVLERRRARENKDWSLSDTLRDQLEAKNILLNDGAHDTTWRHRHTK